MVRQQSLKLIRFGDFLVERGVISHEQLLDSLATHWEQGCRVGDAACLRGYVTRDHVERTAREYQSLRMVVV